MLQEAVNMREELIAIANKEDRNEEERSQIRKRVMILDDNDPEQVKLRMQFASILIYGDTESIFNDANSFVYDLVWGAHKAKNDHETNRILLE